MIVNHHFLLHDALLLAKGLDQHENTIKKLIWITKSVYDEINSDPCVHDADASTNAVRFHHGVPCDGVESQLSSSVSPLRYNNLYHYAALAGLTRVLRFLLELKVTPSITHSSLLCIAPEAGTVHTEGSEDEDGGWTSLQVALRWGSVECLGVLMSSFINESVASLISSKRIVYQSLQFCRCDITFAYVIHQCLVLPQCQKTKRTLLDNSQIQKSDDLKNISDMLSINKFYCPPEREYSDPSDCNNDSLLDAEILKLIYHCSRLGWHSACCLLIQYHFLVLLADTQLLTSQSDERKNLITESYRDIFQKCGDLGYTKVCLVVLQFFHNIRHTWMHPAAPPTLNGQSMYPVTFFEMLRYIATFPASEDAKIMLEVDSPDSESTLNVTETNETKSGESLISDDIFIDLIHFRNLLLSAELMERQRDSVGDGISDTNADGTTNNDSSMLKRRDSIIDAVLGLPLLDRENINPDNGLSTTSNLTASVSTSPISTTLDGPPLLPSTSVALEGVKGIPKNVSAPVLDTRATSFASTTAMSATSKRIVVIRTKDGRKATFVVNKTPDGYKSHTRS